MHNFLNKNAMNKKTTLTRLIAILLFSQCILASSIVSAQYCSPSFVNGCSLWNSQSITLGTINWSLGSTSCTISDYTNLSTNLTDGVAYPMSVTNGNWCGCAVWVDLNMDFDFDSGENLFYDYQANQNNTYNFNITIPAGTPTGSYRLRVISPWGSDGYSLTNVNGYGGCGTNYQYGSFNDFTVTVGPVGVATINTGNLTLVSANINKETSMLTVTMNNFKGNAATLQLADISGRIIETRKLQSEREIFDMSELSNGIYILNYSDGIEKQSIKINK